jgi:hypothetical protein
MESIFHETDFYKFQFDGDIFYMTYKNGPITLEIAKEIVAKRQELMQGREIWALIDDFNLRSIDRDARVYLSTPEGIDGIRAGALLVTSPFAKHLANFFLKITVSKPVIPTRVFTDKQEALDWLHELKKEANTMAHSENEVG